MSHPRRRYAAREIFPLAPGACALGSLQRRRCAAISTVVWSFAPPPDRTSGCDTVSEALGSANRELAGLKPSASTEAKRYSDSETVLTHTLWQRTPGPLTFPGWDRNALGDKRRLSRPADEARTKRQIDVSDQLPLAIEEHDHSGIRPPRGFGRCPAPHYGLLKYVLAHPTEDGRQKSCRHQVRHPGNLEATVVELAPQFTSGVTPPVSAHFVVLAPERRIRRNGEA